MAKQEETPIWVMLGIPEEKWNHMPREQKRAAKLRLARELKRRTKRLRADKEKRGGP